MEVKFSELTTKPLKLTVDHGNDTLYAVEFGKVIDGKSREEYIHLDDSFAYVLDQPLGDMIGFVIDQISDYDLHSTEEIWKGPEFVIPELPMLKATAGELAAMALAVYGNCSTANADAFHYAVSVNDGHDLDVWRACLSAGEMKAHFGLGYSLWEHGHFAEAYAHLRHYTTLAPRNSWVWCWFGKACVWVGELGEAKMAFKMAIELERLGGFETDASELLAELSA